MPASSLCLGLVLLGLVGCSGAARDATPEGAVQSFIEQMSHPNWNRQRARSAYELLSAQARQRLDERATRASALQARTVGPEEMIAPMHFTLHFEPVRYEARVEGRWASVTVLGSHLATERAVVRCVREEQGWRVILDIPPAPEVRKRVEPPAPNRAPEPL